MKSFNLFYNIFISQKKKERFEFILEPMQALVQLSYLAFCPIGSKITIYNNLLYIQTPGWKQSVVRTYYKDSKDDLYFLFNVIGRYNKFYKFLKDSNKEEDRNLYNLLIEMAKTGIDNLIQTYQQSDKTSLLHTLHMYKKMLTNPNAFNHMFSKDTHERSPSPSESGEYSENDERDSNNTNIVNYSEQNNEISFESNIDNIFIQITSLYGKEDLYIIYNTLLLIKNNPQNYLTYMDGLNSVLEPLNNKIKKWINDNIVF